MMKNYINILSNIIPNMRTGTSINAPTAMELIGMSFDVGGINKGKNIAMGRALGVLHNMGYITPVGVTRYFNGKKTKIIDYVIV